MSLTSNIFTEYFMVTAKYTAEYGPQTIVLMQVGAFFEVYGVKTPEGGAALSKIEDFCRIGQLKLAEKAKDRYQGQSLYMAGFGEYNLEKYLKLLTDAGFHCVVFVQEDDMKKAGAKRRVFHAVYSAGTFLSIESNYQISNHIMCVWVHSYKRPKETRYLCGFAVVNIMSGHSFLYEYTVSKILSPTSFDDLERALASFTPTEIIFIHDEKEKEEAEQIIQFTGMFRSMTLHRVAESSEKIQRLSKQQYIDTTLGFYLGEKAVSVCAEFTTYEFATRCFVYLLDFLQGHNPDLIRKISIPVFSNNSSRVILANHTLKQLNILGQGGVLAFLNGTQTAMGSRLFQYQLQNPTFDEDWLQQEYDAIDWAIQKGENQIVSLQKHLSKIRDLERIGRRLLFGKIYPSAVFDLFQGISEWFELLKAIDSEKCSKNSSSLQGFLDFVDSRIHLSRCEGMNHFDYIQGEEKEENNQVAFFKPEGSTTALKEALVLWETAQNTLQGFADEWNATIKKCKSGTTENWIKIHDTAKSGQSLQLTSIRGNHVKDIIQKHGSKEKIGEIPLNQFHVVSSGGVATIENPQLQSTCKEILRIKEKVSRLSGECYQQFLKDLETTWGSFLASEAKEIAKMDVILNKALKAIRLRYCKPEIIQGKEGCDENNKAGCDENNKESSFFLAKDLRHVLIEHLQTNEIYVPNDLTLGKIPEEKGILLFGTNAVGKTSLIKAAGIAVLLAQAGMYVPCKKFQYRPYRAIYSRILGNDDIFRGLSTFVVEMSELRVILKSADSNSLVLGDELCSGTETESALSIFVAGLQHLKGQEASFLFATHFHEIVNYAEVEELTKSTLKLKHLSVKYDYEQEKLVYDRKLQEGSGEAIYGLEVAKSLYMPAAFLEAAFQLRTKYFPVKESPLSCKQSKYNAKKIRTACEICGQRGKEVHHKVAQHLADDQGYISHVHKNHKANLMSVCEACHLKIHST